MNGAKMSPTPKQRVMKFFTKTPAVNHVSNEVLLAQLREAHTEIGKQITELEKAGK